MRIVDQRSKRMEFGNSVTIVDQGVWLYPFVDGTDFTMWESAVQVKNAGDYDKASVSLNFIPQNMTIEQTAQLIVALEAANKIAATGELPPQAE